MKAIATKFLEKEFSIEMAIIRGMSESTYQYWIEKSALKRKILNLA